MTDIIRNAKAVKKILEKSGLNAEALHDMNYIIDNYKGGDFAEWCRDNYQQGDGKGLYNLWSDGISRPTKLTGLSSLNRCWLKKCIEDGMDCRVYGYGKFDYSVKYSAAEKFGLYSREYKGMGNGYYYILLSAEDVLLVDVD